ncbi:MAG TPA: CPBP family intramembrane glutamic endopeptidase [Methanocella sp.]
MTLAGITRVIVFYLFLVFIVFFLSSIGAIIAYVVIILASVLFILIAKVRPQAGNPLPGLVTGTLALTATFGLLLLLGGLAVDGLNDDVAILLLTGIMFQLFVAVGEEISFRGYILEDLRGQYGLPVAIALSSVGFALLHVNSMLLLGTNLASALIALATISAAGVLLALLSLRWGLLSAMGFHFAWNFLQYHVYGLGLGGEFSSVVRVTGAANVLMNGGEFGPEASLPGLAVVIITLGIVWYFYKRNSKHSEHSV